MTPHYWTRDVIDALLSSPDTEDGKVVLYHPHWVDGVPIDMVAHVYRRRMAVMPWPSNPTLPMIRPLPIPGDLVGIEGVPALVYQVDWDGAHLRVMAWTQTN